MDPTAFVSTGQNESNYSELLITICKGGAALVFAAICIPFVTPILKRIRIPYWPSPHQTVENVLEALKGRSGRLVDIGSGDGRIVIAAAKCGFKADGVEINPWLIYYSRYAAFRAGCSKSTSFFKTDLWKYDLSPYKNIVIYPASTMMVELDKKFEAELIDTQVMTCKYPIPTKEPVKVIGEGNTRVWVYKYSKK